MSMTQDNNENIQARTYQEAILTVAEQKNTLVVLPTGTGKTLIAIMLAQARFKAFPLQKVVILAPTRPLIEQHEQSFKKILGNDYAEWHSFTGKTPAVKRQEYWQTGEFIFSTPQCIANDVTKGLYDLHDVSLLIVDEAHRCLKNYAYNTVAQAYKTHATNQRILALTASPGSTKATINEICANLAIEAVEIRTRDSPDVKPYLHNLEFETIEVDYPPELLEIKTLLESLYNEKIIELEERKVVTQRPNKIQLLELQRRLMRELSTSKDGSKMQAVSITAQALKVAHALELIETQTVHTFLEYLRELYKQANEKKSRAVIVITTDARFTKAYTLATQMSREHPKLEKLKVIVTEEFKRDAHAKVIIFAQFRETVRIITETLSTIPGVSAAMFVGQAQKQNSKGRTSGLKQTEQKKVIEQFKEGITNALIATSIAEEGLDIPEVSMVIFYEPIPSAIRRIQRAGRTARLAPGKLTILITKNTRDEAHHYAARAKEKKMYTAIENIKKDFTQDSSQQTLTTHEAQVQTHDTKEH